MEAKAKVRPLQLRLWHGTSKTPPAQVFKKDGLNIVYANDGMWGKGIYFAVNANYSCPAYSFPVPGQPKTYEVFFANVAIGNTCEMPQQARGLFCPPPLPGSADEYYDSVKGHT
jgi:hypothetical protein